MNIPREGRKRGWRPARAASLGFSLVEMLVGISIVALLAALVASGVQGAMKRAKSAQCLAKMRNLGQGIQLYTQDSAEFPRSLHSAAGAGKPTWAKAILPYMGYVSTLPAAEWSNVFEKLYRCPVDTNHTTDIYSYALNVYFELTPDGDDYTGSPATWRKPISLNHGSATILLAEPKPVYYADHIMGHLWTSAAGATNAVDVKRHALGSNYLFVDGHVATLPILATYDPAKGIDLWNPSLAK